jgi:hypothetical protein
MHLSPWACKRTRQIEGTCVDCHAAELQKCPEHCLPLLHVLTALLWVCCRIIQDRAIRTGQHKRYASLSLSCPRSSRMSSKCLCLLCSAEVVPGYYAINALQMPPNATNLTVITSAEPCPVGSYNPGFNVSIDCIPCPSGTTTKLIASTQASSCSKCIECREAKFGKICWPPLLLCLR